MPDPMTSLASLLPHRAPLLWIDALVECAGSTAAATAFFGPDHFAVVDGVVPEAVLVECVAQTVAAAAGERARRQTHARADDPTAVLPPTGPQGHARRNGRSPG